MDVYATELAAGTQLQVKPDVGVRVDKALGSTILRMVDIQASNETISSEVRLMRKRHGRSRARDPTTKDPRRRDPTPKEEDSLRQITLGCLVRRGAFGWQLGGRAYVNVKACCADGGPIGE